MKKDQQQGDREKKSTRHVVFQVSFVVVCGELYRTDLRWTQNTRTSPPDITLSNKLWSDGDRNTSKTVTAQSQKLASYEGKPFRKSFARDTRY